MSAETNKPNNNWSNIIRTGVEVECSNKITIDGLCLVRNKNISFTDSLADVVLSIFCVCLFVELKHSGSRSTMQETQWRTNSLTFRTRTRAPNCGDNSRENSRLKRTATSQYLIIYVGTYHIFINNFSSAEVWKC